LAFVQIERVERRLGVVTLAAHVVSPTSSCPRCGTTSGRVHSRYQRHLGDLPTGGQPVVVELTVRPFFCNGPCHPRTFAEQVEHLTSRYARRSVPAAGLVTQLGLMLAGRPAARMAAVIGLSVGRNTLIRSVRALPDPAIGTVEVLGGDDFAVRRGRIYGTILLDMADHRPIDLFEGREADDLAAWLIAHPGVEVVCRDRGGAYADGARRGAPDAIQVADRFHLWKNLGEHVKKTVTAHHACLRQAADDALRQAQQAWDQRPGPEDQATAAAVKRVDDTAIAQRIRRTFAEVQELKATGLGIRRLKRATGLAKGTVSRYYHASDVEELLVATRIGKSSVLDDYKPYIHERFNAGDTNIKKIWAEIRAMGCTAAYSTLRDYMKPFRTVGAAPPARTAAPKVGEATTWLLTHPDNLDEDETMKLKQVTAACPHLAATAEFVGRFAHMLTELEGDQLEDWLTDVEASDLPHLKTFANGIRHDHNAVVNGLTLDHNSGAVEGAVNRLKVYKRQMYGRANFDLLRKRVLLSP